MTETLVEVPSIKRGRGRPRTRVRETLDINRPQRVTGTQVKRKQKASLQFMLESVKATDIGDYGVDHMIAAQRFYGLMCAADPANIEHWMDKRWAVAARLAPYQSPTFQAIQVTGNSQDQAALAKLTDAELAMALKARAEALGMEVRIRSRIEHRAKGGGVHDIDERIVPLDQQRAENEQSD